MPPTQETSLARKSPGIRLDYVDGLRGLAALYVVLHHIHHEFSYRTDLPVRVQEATKFLELGHYAVAVFIVVSGYSLMLSQVRSERGTVAGGFGGFIKRRAWRILPPYYAALFLSIVLIVLTPDLRQVTGWRSDIEVPSFTAGEFFSHIFMVHNVNPEWVYKINSPMWSLATEWQIYLLFPVLLLPVWRRAGGLALLAVAFFIGIVPNMLMGGRFNAAMPWYLGLFALGMMAAEIGFSRKPIHSALRTRVPWGSLVLVFGIALAACVKICPWRLTLTDTLAGAGAASLLIFCTIWKTSEQASPQPWVAKLLEARWAVALGAFSYSLYLIHSPLISLMHIWLRNFDPSPVMRMVALMAFATPLIVGVAFLFHLVFEKPFLPQSLRAARSDGDAKQGDPASGNVVAARAQV